MPNGIHKNPQFTIRIDSVLLRKIRYVGLSGDRLNEIGRNILMNLKKNTVSFLLMIRNKLITNY